MRALGRPGSGEGWLTVGVGGVLPARAFQMRVAKKRPMMAIGSMAPGQ